MYTTKDLVNLLQLMRTSRQSGDLTVEPHEQEKAAWQGYFRLVDGQIASCQVRDKIDGQIILQGDEAIRWLANPAQGKLAWSLEETTHPSGTLLPLLPTQNRATTSKELYEEKTAKSYLPTHSLDNVPREQSVSQDSGSMQSTSPMAPNAIPYRTERGIHIPSNVLSSRDHRQVFSLIDGNRNIAEIVRLLHKSPDVIIYILNELKALGLIE